jgi:hypothetical protein
VIIDHAQLEARASIMAGTPVTIACQTAAEMKLAVNESPDSKTTTWGYVLTDPDTGKFLPVIFLRKQLCRDLYNLGSHTYFNSWDTTNPNDEGYGPKASEEDGKALSVLLHEAIHQRSGPQATEAYVECQTYRNRWAAIKQFRPMKTWKQLRIFWGMKIMHDDTPDEYREIC